MEQQRNDNFDREFIMEFLEWVAQNCEIKKAADPWTGDIWKNWFYYKG